MKITPLAQDHVTVFESPDPATVHCYSPGLARCPSGRLVATLDLGGEGAGRLEGPRLERGEGGRAWQGQVLTSDDRGRSWTHRTRFAFMHARPFVAGGRLYVLGQGNDLMVMASDDDGESWTPPVKLTEGEQWHQAPSNVHYAHGCVYLVMEQRRGGDIQTWNVGQFAPVLMRARVGDDLTRRQSWTFASAPGFHEVIDNRDDCPQLDWFGVPFHRCPYPRGAAAAPGRHCAPIGWLEANVVQFVDPDHVWADPSGRTYHLWLRAHTGGTGYAAICKVVEQQPGGGAMTTRIETAPSGKRVLYVPCPGGQMKFHVLYDEPTRLFWLLSTQATDSMCRADRLPADRYNLPNNQRRRLQLHFSRNMIDWCFAGLVTEGPAEHAARNYASMVVDGEDLHVLSRSGDTRARNAHDGNLITFHTIPGFRELVY